MHAGHGTTEGRACIRGAFRIRVMGKSIRSRARGVRWPAKVSRIRRASAQGLSQVLQPDLRTSEAAPRFSDESNPPVNEMGLDVSGCLIIQILF